MTLPDLQRQIQDLNNTLLLRNLIETKIVMDKFFIENDDDEAAVPNWAATKMNQLEQLLDDMYNDDEEMYHTYFEWAVESADTEDLYEQLTTLTSRAERVKERIAQSIAEYPTTVDEMYSLMSQYGVKYLHNVNDVIDAMASLHLEPTMTKIVEYTGPHGQKYYLVPKPGWSANRKGEWTYISTKPVPTVNKRNSPL